MGDMLPNQIKMEILDQKEFQVISSQLITNNHSTTNSTLNEDESPCPIISQFDTESDLSLMQSLQVQNESLDSEFEEVSRNPTLNDEMIDDIDDKQVLIQHMDIRTCLSQLREMLEKRIGTELIDYEFWLQDSKMLESHKTLVDQCIRGEGIVQVNLQIKPLLKRINIIDVLKPDEEYINTDSVTNYCDDDNALEEEVSIDDIPIDIEKQNGDIINNNDNKKQLKMVRWTVDARFKADQVRLNIPEDPHFWTVPQVKYWIQWAVRQFNLTGIKLSDWTISGSELCNLTVEEFKAKCPSDPIDLFWTHLELLRKCKFIAIVQSEESEENAEPEDSSFCTIKKKLKQPSLLENSNVVPMYYSTAPRSGNNGQIQLWQFLLELLTSTEHTNVIQWIGGNGEFKLQDPEIVAQLWGQRKHKPTMNYEKLSRALRYYYDGDMIAKVHNKRFVYRFVCDLKQLIGYDASDLSRLVNSGNPTPKNTKLNKQSEVLYYSRYSMLGD